MGSVDIMAEEESELIIGKAKSQALDTASLLGGNEVLVAQLLKGQERHKFNYEEKSVIRWALNHLWKDSEPENDVPGQSYFSEMFLPDVKKDLPRLLANCLLYCVRYEDTTFLWTNPDRPTYRILVLDATSSLHAQETLARIGDKKIPCTKLAMVYNKPQEPAGSLNVPSPSKVQLSSSPADMMQRRLGNNRLFEYKLMNALDMVAVIPAP